MSRVPTEKQYRTLRMLGNGDVLVVGTQRQVGPLLRHGWVTASGPSVMGHGYYAFVRITPDGLRALARAVERYGLPELAPRREDAA